MPEMWADAATECRILRVKDEARVAAQIDDALAAALEETVDLNPRGVPTYPVADVPVGRIITFNFAAGYGGSGVEEAYAGQPTLQKPFTQGSLGDATAAIQGPGS